MDLALRQPALDMLPSYRQALERGFSPDNIALGAATQRELARIAEDAAAFVASLDDLEAKGGPIRLPDGTEVERLPGFRRWLWDGEFSGSFGFRFRPQTSELPPHVLGHIGYVVPDWKAGGGYATRGLALLLEEVRTFGLAYVELVTEPDNVASQKVILANGGALVGRVDKTPHYGGGEGLKFRISL
jgi:predicted acetyltransferase